jgi:ribosomal protein S20
LRSGACSKNNFKNNPNMPIIKSAKKRVKQAAVKQARNYNTRVAVRKAIRRLNEAVKAGDKAEATKLLSAAYKVIDTADKKNVLQSNTAARRKAGLAKAVAGIGAKKTKTAEKPAAKKPAAKKPAAKAPAKKAAPKKEAVKKEEPKEEKK